MKFEEALYNFRNEILKEYGPKCELIKIAVSHEMFESIQKDIYSPNRSFVSYTTAANFSDFKMFDIEIVARKKEVF